MLLRTDSRVRFSGVGLASLALAALLCACSGDAADAATAHASEALESDGPRCWLSPTIGTLSPVEPAFKAAGCMPLGTFYPDQRSFPFARVTLCPSSDAVRQIVATNSDFFAFDRPRGSDWEACLPKASDGKAYVFYRLNPLRNPNCPRNCIDTEEGDESTRGTR